MTPIYLVDAREEIDEAAAYYDAIATHLGRRFRLAVRDGVRRAAGHPLWWPVIEDPVRRYLVTGWPYSIYYVPTPGHLLVVAVGHQHRRPSYWRDRLEQRTAPKSPPAQ